MMKTKPSRAVALFAVAMMAALLPASPSAAAPTIKFLNPSDYSTPMRISTKEDATGDTAYHLVAWSGEVPTNPFVEFELSPSPIAPGGGSDPTAVATINGTRVGTTDTFEGDLSAVGIPDGQYFLRAILYANFIGPNTGQEVARDQIAVTLQSSGQTAANTAEMTYPTNGGPLGFWKSGDKPGVAVVTGFASAGTAQVRVLYTTSASGTDPDWAACGSGSVSNNAFRVRCTLAAGVSPSSVKAVAAVANQTPPPAPATSSADETGDAHRVVSYLQDPSTIDLDPDSSTTDQGKCTLLTGTVTDQSGFPIATMNVDVHAQGPDDQLRFATQQINGANQHSGFQAPDAAHTGNEGTARCSATDPENKQGDHNVAGGNDIKHIESTGGTNNLGQFTFILLSGTKGGTQITAWGDENDDDNLNAGEASGNAQLGWGQAPPPPATNLNLDPSSRTATVGECERLEVTAIQNGVPQSGRNVDIHISNPTGVSFCNPGDSGTSPPDAGGHVGDVDPGQGNTRHAEGTTNSSGELIFGVTSPSAGKTSVAAWLDENNNDALEASETLAAGTIDWLQAGDRSISIHSSKNSVEAGGRVKLSGRIEGTNACVGNQKVKIQAKKGSGRFRTIAKEETNGQGNYSTKVRVRTTKKYRAVAPRNAPCDKVRSRTIKVRAT